LYAPVCPTPTRYDPHINGGFRLQKATLDFRPRQAVQKGFQVCTHAIGDAGNRATLDAYQAALGENPSIHDPRLRIEHAQVLASPDIVRFSRLGVIPSMQPTHATSDIAWADNRVG